MTTGATGQPEAISHFRLTGLFCVACAGAIETALLGEPGVTAARVSYAGQRATVNWNPQHTSPSRLVERVVAAGYGAAPDVGEQARSLRLREGRKMLWRVFVALFCATQVMMYTTPLYIAEPGAIGADLQRLLQWASWLLSIPVLAFAAGPFFSDAWHGLREHRIRMELPVALGIGTAFVAGSAALFDTQGVFGSELYFDSLTMFVSLLLVARWFAQRAHDRVASALEDALHRLPAAVRRVDASGRATLVPLHEIVVGDTLRVLAGEAFPADGPVVEGTTSADEALLTGESSPVPKSPGSVALAGSLNLTAPVSQRVERLGADTRHDGIVALLRGAAGERPRLVRATDRLAGPFLIAVLLLALGAAAFWASSDPAHAVRVAVAVLIVTCPCALSLAAPSALLTTAGALARRGILVARLDAIETLAALDTVCFDKTGTLTEDRLHLQRVVACPAASRRGLEAQTLLGMAASMAFSSTHPAARAIAAAHQAGGDESAGAAWQRIVEVPGGGVEARDAAGRCYRLGARQWVESVVPAPPAGGAAGTGLSVDGELLAVFELGEVLRRDAAATVQALHGAGLAIEILSGDTAQRVRAVAERLGIAAARGGLRPEHKLAALAEMQRRGRRVGMVGDGLNDAPVIACADVSFAMAGGSALTRSRADFIVLSGRLGDVAEARATAQRAMRIIRQSLGWALVYNAVCVPLAVAGQLAPWAAAVGMGASSLFVVMNAIRIDRRPRAGREARPEDPDPAVAAVSLKPARAP
jgi:Cu2+-exporting ATPase